MGARCAAPSVFLPAAHAKTTSGANLRLLTGLGLVDVESAGLPAALVDRVEGELEVFAAHMRHGLLSAAAGLRSLRLSRCVEEPNRYLLLAEWEQFEDHTIGFRSSTAYQEWWGLLHHFYDPFPTVTHYEDRVAIR